MKHTILYICLLLTVLVHAQEADTETSEILIFEKGTQFVNTNFSIGLTNSEFKQLDDDTVVDIKRNSFSFRASYAYGIAENLFVGTGLSYAHRTDREESADTGIDTRAIANTYGIFPFIRYYKGIGKKLALYLQAEASIEHSNGETTNTNGFSTGLRPGITFMMNKNLALEASLGFLGYFSNATDDEITAAESDAKGFRFSLNSSNLLFGLNYYF